MDAMTVVVHRQDRIDATKIFVFLKVETGHQ